MHVLARPKGRDSMNVLKIRPRVTTMSERRLFIPGGSGFEPREYRGVFHPPGSRLGRGKVVPGLPGEETPAQAWIVDPTGEAQASR